MTETCSDFAVLPPAPLQLSVKVVVLVSAGLVIEPLVGCLPLQPPDALQAVAFWLVHTRFTVPPEATELASLVNVTSGAAGAEAMPSA